jgi:acetylornithine/N-succinyldiaminopimelate aminotransferase
VVIDGRAAAGLQPGDHGTTFGGSPVPCAAALAHLRYRETHDLDAHVREVGALLRTGLHELERTYPDVFEAPRGRGLMLGLPVRPPHVTATFVAAARDRERLLVNGAGKNVLRFVPPLTLSVDETADAVGRLRRAVAFALSSPA